MTSFFNSSPVDTEVKATFAFHTIFISSVAKNSAFSSYLHVIFSMMSFQIFENHLKLRVIFFWHQMTMMRVFIRVPKRSKCFLYLKLFHCRIFITETNWKRGKDKDKATVDKRVVMEWMATEKIAKRGEYTRHKKVKAENQ